MVQFNLYVHGVPIGHEICPRDAEEDYLKDFYSHDKEIKETSFMQIDIVNGKSFYTYLHKKNVCSEIGRPGSYLGLTVCFPRQYCTNVHTLYEILRTIYERICIGCLIKQESGNERFIVREIATAQFKGNLAVDYIKAAFKQNMERYLSNSFDVLDGSSNSVGEVKFSLNEVDSMLFRETMKKNRVLISPEFQTTSETCNFLLLENTPLKRENERFRQDNTQMKERNKSLSEEVAKLEKDLSNAEASASKKYKKQLEEIEAKCRSLEKEKRKLEDKIKEISSTVNQIDVPIRTLTRLVANRFPEDGEKITEKHGDAHLKNRSENSFKTWMFIIYLLLLLCVLAISGYGCFILTKLSNPFPIATQIEKSEIKDVDIQETAEQAVTKSDTCKSESTTTDTEASDPEVSPTYDDYADCKINIGGYSGSGNLEKGKTYTLSIVKTNEEKANVPNGSWTATTDSNLPGIIITGNNFTVDKKVLRETNVMIKYVVEEKDVKHRTIKVQ